jgi:putative membrane protein
VTGQSEGQSEKQSEWRRVHPLSPLLRMWAALVGVAVVLLAQNSETLGQLRDWIGDAGLSTWLLVLAAVAVVVGVLLLGWVLSLPWWWAAGYRVTGEEIAVRRGVLSKQLRTARFDRVQAVDLVEPLPARPFRLAGVKVETAGGRGSEVTVEYLPRADAEELRVRLLDLVRAEPAGPAEPARPTGSAAQDRPDQAVFIPQIPVSRSLVAAALSGSTAWALISLVLSLATPAGLALLVPALAGLLPWFWSVLNRSWRYTATLSGPSDAPVLGITFGFSERRRQSVPLHRVHAVRVSQPVLWRILGWWRVDVDVAGYGEQGARGSTTAVLPVGDIGQASRVLAVLGPLSTREVADYADPEHPATPTYASPASARWVSPLDRRRQGVTLVGEEPHAVVCRHGRVSRRVEVISPAHIQELSWHRGPVDRVLGLAGVRLDLVPGPVTMRARQLTVADATALFGELRHRRLPPPGDDERRTVMHVTP